MFCVAQIPCKYVYLRYTQNYAPDSFIVVSFIPCHLALLHLHWKRSYCGISMMTSSNGNIYSVTGLCAGNSSEAGEIPSQSPVTRSFDVFFELCQNKRLRKKSWGWWFERLSRLLWRHGNGINLSHRLPSMELITARCRYNVVRYNTTVHKALHGHRHSMNISVYTACVVLSGELWLFLCQGFEKIEHAFKASHCIST